MSKQLRKTFATDSGMLAIWDHLHFPNVVDYDTWEAQLLEDVDIAKHIDAGAFVPLYIHADGAFECDLRIGTTDVPAILTERENKYLLVLSEPYLFRSTGTLCISGIEHIESKPGSSVGILPLEAAEWSVIVHLIDWPEEPGARNADGKPSATALPDFVVLVNPANDRLSSYRKKIDTFEKP